MVIISFEEKYRKSTGKSTKKVHRHPYWGFKLKRTKRQKTGFPGFLGPGEPESGRHFPIRQFSHLTQNKTP